ncbi:MAG TPA: hypothetical protein VF743_05680 [Acidimicrobiales bacterium]
MVREKECVVYHLPPGPLSPERDLRDVLDAASGELVAGEWYYLECRWVDDDDVTFAHRWQYQPGQPEAGPSAEALARQAYDQVPLVVPQPRTSPPADMPQLVGFPTWLWIDAGAWQTFTAEAAIPGLSVTVTATPQRVDWDLGDGTRLVCHGPGTPLVGGTSGAGDTDCAHTYQFVSAHQPGGRYHLTATVTWAVSWQASTGESGTLADATRAAALDLDVTERQAVITYGPRRVTEGRT